jgi:hypothetical protein
MSEVGSKPWMKAMMGKALVAYAVLGVLSLFCLIFL